MMRLPLLASLVLIGCGYTVVNATAPLGAHRIALVPFREDAEVGVAADLADELGRLLAAGGVELTANEDSADGVLTGRVRSANTLTAPVRDSASAVSSYRLEVQVEAILKRKTGEQIQASVDITEPFLRGGSEVNASALDSSKSDLFNRVRPLATEANRREAVHRIALEAARQLHERLVLASFERS